MRSHLAFPGRKPEPSSNSDTRLHLPFVKLCLTFPSRSPRLEAGCHPALQDRDGRSWYPAMARSCPSRPHPVARNAQQLRILGKPQAWDGRRETKWFGVVFFFARTLIRCGNQRLKVTYTAIASHAEPNIHRRKYRINYNAEQHSISAIVPLQL